MTWLLNLLSNLFASQTPREKLAMKPTVLATPDKPPVNQRFAMAQQIVNMEARRDKAGNLLVYNMPANDGGGSYEIAGINQRYHPTKALQLKNLILSSQNKKAEEEAVKYLADYTESAAKWVKESGVNNNAVEFYLRDTLFNRGAGGAMKILQHAVETNMDGGWGPKTREAMSKFAGSPLGLLDRLRVSREHYERHVVGYRANFWRGLINRFDRAKEIALTFA